MGSNPIGYGCGTWSPTGPLVLILLLICSEAQADSCWKCYQNLYYGTTRGSYLVAHTHVNSVCYNSKRLETCSTHGQTYWIAKNLGSGGIRRGLGCPRGEGWICFTKNGHWDTSDGGGVQDLVKQEIIRNTPKRPVSPPASTQVQKPDIYTRMQETLKNEIELPQWGRNLFVDLGERISKEFNLTNCWVCGGPLMTEEWP